MKSHTLFGIFALSMISASCVAPEPNLTPTTVAVERAPTPPMEATTPEPVEEEPQPRWEWLLRRYQPDPYMLDHVSRDAERDERGRLQCPDVEMVGYAGDRVRYHRALRVNDSFRERLAKFEEVVARVGEQVYGRAPARISHYGSYNCRVIGHRKYRLSEHALGNAIDIAGFRFDALPRDERDRAPEGLGHAFSVDVEDHWEATSGKQLHHAIFLKTLVDELRRERVFRGVIVPPAPGHKNHLHLDMGRWRFMRGDTALPTS